MMNNIERAKMLHAQASATGDALAALAKTTADDDPTAVALGQISLQLTLLTHVVVDLLRESSTA